MQIKFENEFLTNLKSILIALLFKMKTSFIVWKIEKNIFWWLGCKVLVQQTLFVIKKNARYSIFHKRLTVKCQDFVQSDKIIAY